VRGNEESTSIKVWGGGGGSLSLSLSVFAAEESNTIAKYLTL